MSAIQIAVIGDRLSWEKEADFVRVSAGEFGCQFSVVAVMKSSVDYALSSPPNKIVIKVDIVICFLSAYHLYHETK